MSLGCVTNVTGRNSDGFCARVRVAAMYCDRQVCDKLANETLEICGGAQTVDVLAIPKSMGVSPTASQLYRALPHSLLRPL